MAEQEVVQEVQEAEVQEAQEEVDYSAKIAEMQKQIDDMAKAVKSARSEKTKAEKAAEAALNENKAMRADSALKAAVEEGKLTPAQVSEGSWFVKLAHEHPDYFAGIMEQLASSKMPTQAQLADNKIPPQSTEDMIVERFQSLIKQGISVDEALRRAHAEVGK